MISKDVFSKELNNSEELSQSRLKTVLQRYQNTKKIILTHKKCALIQGDVLDENAFDQELFDLIITSPPYNVDIKYNSHKDDLSYEEYLIFSEKWMRNCFRWTKNQGRFCLNIPLDKNKGGQKSVGADLTTLAQKIGWKYHSTIIWNEGNISRRTAWGSWLSAAAPYVIAPVELIVVLYKGEWKKNSGSKLSDITKDEFMEWTNGLWTFNGESKKRIGHPAPFPIELPYRCIKLFSFVDDLVFDPFAGSGTTLIAANNTNRYSVGLEIDIKYCELAKQRIINETGMLF
jgi:site-specific DNA-methyltransferase (adenine-specific)